MILVAVILFGFAAGRAYVAVVPQIPKHQKLSTLPAEIASYHSVADENISDEVQAVLKADDYVLRRYVNDAGAVDVFIAYYEYQRAGESMHSPKNCLPGSGWNPVLNDYVSIGLLPNGREAIANRYVIEKESQRDVVVYWYQSSGRVIANEYWGKFYLVSDALRTGRRDGAILRVVVPVRSGESVNAATKRAADFARELLPAAQSVLPV
jgi:EpsI family protein